MNPRFHLLLDWLRRDSSDYAMGYTSGYIAAMPWNDLEPWQWAYIHNVKSQIMKGKRA